jgi:chromosome segregation ATPase
VFYRPTACVVQTEKQSLRAQCDTLHREISATNDENGRLVARVHELEKENVGLRSRAEETTHRCKLDVSNVRVEMLRERGEIERDRDRMSGQLKGKWHRWFSYGG